MDIGQQTAPEKELAVRFAREHLIPKAAELDMPEDGAPELLPRMGGVGFLGMGTTPRYGGIPSDAFSPVLVLEKLSKGNASMALCCLTYLAACRAIVKEGPTF